MAVALSDSFGRVHRDLRISVTDRCNFRCAYCMPEEGMVWRDRDELLTFEEIERLARLFVGRYGVDSIRLTGGEPMVRAGLPILVAKLADLGADLALTTNGSTLRAHAAQLADAGLRRINISLDTLRRDRFVELTRRDELHRVLDGIDAALEARLDPVKINVVLMRGINDDEVVELAHWGRDLGVHVRFIEFMPLDGDDRWSREIVVPQAEIIQRIDEVLPLEPIVRGHEPAERFRYLDGGGDVGVIASITQPFCDTCDRVRLTADGQLRACLFAVEETDLRVLLRGGASDDEVAAAIERTVSAKWAGHMIQRVDFIRPSRSMSEIGG